MKIIEKKRKKREKLQKALVCPLKIELFHDTPLPSDLIPLILSPKKEADILSSPKLCAPTRQKRTSTWNPCAPVLLATLPTRSISPPLGFLRMEPLPRRALPCLLPRYYSPRGGVMEVGPQYRANCQPRYKEFPLDGGRE